MGKTIKEYTDSFGLLGAGVPSFDGGDTCAQEFTVAYCKSICFPERNITAEYDSKMTQMMDASTKKYVRHPDQTKWYSNPENLSRDQMTPLLAAMIADPNHRTHRNNLFWQHLKRGFLFAFNTRQNYQYPTQAEQLEKDPSRPWDYSWKMPDPTFMEIWAMWIRAFRAWPLYPLLLIFDLQTLGACLFRYGQTIATAAGPDRDNRNTILPTHISKTFMPTPWGFLAWWILKKTPLELELREFFGDRPDMPPVGEYLQKLLGDYPGQSTLPCEVES